MNNVGHFSPACVGLPSGEGVGHGIFLLANEGQQRLIGGGIKVRRFVGIQELANQLITALFHALFALGFPLFKRVIVRERRGVESSLEIFQRVRTAKIMAARTDFADGVGKA